MRPRRPRCDHVHRQPQAALRRASIKRRGAHATDATPLDWRTDSLVLSARRFLNDLTGKDVIVKLKWGMEYEGKLLSVDSYMNVQLGDAKEYIDGQLAGALGEILIRCNNVMYMRQSPAGGLAAMEE